MFIPQIFSKSLILYLLITSLLMSSVYAQKQSPGQGIQVQPIQSTISEETFQTLLVSKALTDLGYQVQPIKEVDYNVAYLSIASGDATFLASNWGLLHQDMYESAGGDEQFYRQGTFISSTIQGYLIDKKTAEQYHIKHIEQLKDPKIAKLFDSDGDGKADLTGCAPGWGCEATINQQLQDYGLNQTVKNNQGNYNAIIADTIARYQEGKPILYYTWTPYWVSDILKPGRDVIWLEVPFSSNPNHIDTQLANGRNYGFAVDNMKIVANKHFAEQNPVAAKLFAIMSIPLGDINAENAAMRSGQNKTKDIERHVDSWIAAHQLQYEDWLAQARQAATNTE